jgi:hypothetical protein
MVNVFASAPSERLSPTRPDYLLPISIMGNVSKRQPSDSSMLFTFINLNRDKLQENLLSPPSNELIA